MREPFDIEHDAHGCALCPLCRADDGPAFGDECQWRGLHLVWEFAIPVDRNPGPVTDAWVPGSAITSAWRVECNAGHVLAVSAAEEDAEPFDPTAIFRSAEVAR